MVKRGFYHGCLKVGGETVVKLLVAGELLMVNKGGVMMLKKWWFHLQVKLVVMQMNDDMMI